ncbi:alcohol dehydrogenase [Streptomyces antioxidans]|uniref:Alcohol dehydrogenase n=2 Tax=Streptomyces TaxID=1883 RepID=A0A1V4D7X4_9ACTN|nr:alcohol dehydrogenase [Streptomyces antioxidans]
MRILRHYSYGGPTVLQLDEEEIPTPGPGEVRLRVKATPVVFYDICNRRGDFATKKHYEDESVLPISPGYQGAGIVEEVGPEVDNVRVGDRVAWAAGSGACATHVIQPVEQLIPIPDDIDLHQVAGGLYQAYVAYSLTHEAYPLQPDEWCVVQSAAGGVGQLICQLARVRGARVIGVTSTEEKAKVAEESGASEVIVSSTSDVAAEVRRITGGAGARVVYDGVGKDAFETNMDSLGLRGYLVIYGQSSGFVPPFDLMALQEKGGLYLTRWSPLCYLTRWPDENHVANLYRWLRSGELTVRIDRSYPLTEASEAHRVVEQRESAGRVLLLP